MISEDNSDYRLLMSEGLKDLTDKIVFEGVTPKSGMKKVKAMKRLWRSDSFQIMKSILEEPPIQEGRARSPIIALKDDDDDELAETEVFPKETLADKLKKEREIEFSRRKEEMRIHYQECLEDDLSVLQMKADEIITQLLAQAKLEVEATEKGQLEDAAKQNINEMKKKIKCFRKHRNKVLKMAVEEDRRVVTEELKYYIERDVANRIKTYVQLLEKMYNYKIRSLEESIADEYENKLRQKIRQTINKFEFAKNKLLQQHKKDLKDLNCRLENEYFEHEKWSQNRVEAMLEEALNDLKQGKELERKNVEESECSLEDRMKSKLRDKGLLPWEPSKDEDWGSLVCELLMRYQVYIDLVLGDNQTKQNDYLLSMEKLKSFKDHIGQITHTKLIEKVKIRSRQKMRFKAKLRAASLINHLIRDVLPSPLPSRYSISQLGLRHTCRPHRTLTFVGKSFQRAPEDRSRMLSKSPELPRMSRTSRKTIAFIPKGESNVLETGVYSEEEINSFVNILNGNVPLYNILFFNL